VLVVSALLNSKREPGAPPVWGGGWPLVGHFLSFAVNPLAVIREGYAKFGPVFTMRFLHYNMTFLVGAEAHTPFFRANDDELSQNEPYKFMTPIFGEGVVFDAPLAVKNQQLKFVAGALKGGALKTYVSQIVAEASAFLDGWGDSGERDLLDEMANLTILTASRCLLGREVRETLFGEFSLLFKDIDEGINPIAIFFPYAPLPAFWRRDAARKKIGEIFAGVIAGRRRSEVKQDDMLQAFIDAQYADGSSCTDDQITGLLIGTLFAGQHTSSISTTWTVLNLLHKPDLMRRAMDELVVALGTTDSADASTTNMATLQSCSFLHNCMKESLRIAPPLIMLMRQVHRPLQVCGFTVPRNHLVFAPLAVTMNLPNEAKACAFRDPEVFDPDRFEKPREEGKGTLAFCAFGGGTHGCLGEQFGYLQVKTIVSLLLRRFELEVVGPLPKPNHQAMVVGPLQTKKSCIVRYRRRKAPLPAPAGWAPPAAASAASVPA